MAENLERSSGRSENFRFDRGGQIADVGPFVGVVPKTTPAAGDWSITCHHFTE
jgi:hypothetical protein